MDQKEKDREVLNQVLNKSDIKPYKKRQVLAILSYLSGVESAKIAVEMDVNLRTIQRYIKEYSESGIDTILTKRKPGNTQKLNPIIQEELKGDLTIGPQSGGYIVEDWTASLLAKHIRKKYNIRLNVESCRKMIRKFSPVRKQYRTSRSGFKEKVTTWIKEGADVWLVGDIFLGYMKPPKIQKYKIPYQPGDELLSEEEIKEKKIDLTRGTKKGILTIAKNLTTKEVIHRIDSSYQDKIEIRLQLLKKLVKQSQSEKIIILFKKSNINTRVATRAKNNKSMKRIIVAFRPPMDYLNDLDEIKMDLIKHFELRGTFNGPKTFPDQTFTQISNYLNTERSNS